MISVLLADDQLLVRAGFRALLNAEPDIRIVGEAGDGLEAVIEGAAQRLRPILMTAVATVFALLPMALGLTGGGLFISQPLAIVVIGGLISSTLLTLVLVPVLYVLATRIRGRPTVVGIADDGVVAPHVPGKAESDYRGQHRIDD